MKNVLKEKEIKALNQALTELLGPIYYYYFIDNNLIIELKGHKLKEHYKNTNDYILSFPSKEEIKKKIKQKYKKFDFNNLINIDYLLADITIDKFLFIDSKENIIIDGFANFKNGLVIKCDKGVKNRSDFWKYGEKNLYIDCNKIFEINANLLLFENTDIKFNNELQDNTIRIEGKTLILENSNILNSKSTTLVLKNLILENSKINSKENIFIHTKNIDYKNSKINCDNLFYLKHISYEPFEYFNTIDAKNIIYNDLDITNSEEIKLPKQREKLIKVLKEIKTICSNNISNKTKEYENNLKKDSIQKVLKKED